MRAYAALAAAALIVLAAVVLAPSGDPPADEAPGSEYPEGVSVDGGTVSYVSEQEWHITDLLSPAYVKDGRDLVPYAGCDGYGSSLELSPGIYRLEVDGLDFEVAVPWTLERECSWEYDLDGRTERVGISYTLDVLELREQLDAGRSYNATSSYRFSDLPDLVLPSGTTDSIATALADEFERIGGDVSDRRALADFIASFAQLAVSYPEPVTVDGKRMGEDWSTYGRDEYWATPMETLNLLQGDCEDKSILLAALYEAAGYEAAVCGIPGHVVAGVAIENFTEVSKKRLDELGVGWFLQASSAPVNGGDTMYRAVETIRGQTPVGYIGGGDSWFGQSTLWGTSGFYPVHGADSGIHGPL